MSQRAHNQGASNVTFRWRIWCHLAKIHVCAVCKAFEYLEVIRYVNTPISESSLDCRALTLVMSALWNWWLQAVVTCIPYLSRTKLLKSLQNLLITHMVGAFYCSDGVSRYKIVVLYKFAIWCLANGGGSLSSSRWFVLSASSFAAIRC